MYKLADWENKDGNERDRLVVEDKMLKALLSLATGWLLRIGKVAGWIYILNFYMTIIDYSN